MITGFGNNVVSALAENVTSVQTTITVMPDQGAMFAALLTADLENPSNPQNMYAIITLTNSGQTVREICHLTAVKGDVLTVVRGREGTTVRGWSLNDVVANFATRGSENGFVQVEQLQTGQYTAAVAGGSENALAIQLPGTFFLNNATDWTFRTPIIVVPTLTNTGAATLQLVIGGKVLGTFPLYKGNKAELEAGDIIADIPIACLLDKSKTFFSVINPVKVYSLDKGLVRSVNKILPNDKGAVTLKPHDISAVQANGGTHSDGDHNIQIEWDGKLHGTVDSTYVGEFFTTQNPPTPAQSNSYPMWGGDLNRGASLGVISADQSPNTGDTIYSSWVRCCLGGRGGDQDFKDGATGLMRVVEHVGSEAYLEVLWDGFGSVHSFKFDQNGNIRADGGLYDGSGRVYSPGNCPFPVGYVMLMGNGTNPNGIYPGTTWQFLNGTGYDGRVIALGQDPLATGGSNSVTLAEAHMPPHRHNGGATGDASTKPDDGAGQWGTGRFGTDAKGGYALMQTSAAGSGQAFSVQNEYVHLMGWMRTA